MIRDAVVHLQGEQPLLADLPALPTAGDVCLVCTNLRTVDGKRPVFIDASRNTFVIPVSHIRFIEIAQRAGQATAEAPESARGTSPAEAEDVLQLGAGAGDEGELDEEFLRRIREV